LPWGQVNHRASLPEENKLAALSTLPYGQKNASMQLYDSCCTKFLHMPFQSIIYTLLLMVSSAGTRTGNWNSYVRSLLFGVQPVLSRDSMVSGLRRIPALREPSLRERFYPDPVDSSMAGFQTPFVFRQHPLFSAPFEKGNISVNDYPYPDTIGLYLPPDPFARRVTMEILFTTAAEMQQAYNAIAAAITALADDKATLADLSMSWKPESAYSYSFFRNKSGSPIRVLHLAAVKPHTFSGEPEQYAVVVGFYGDSPSDISIRWHPAGD
jgi:hypothetical protein